MINQVTQLQRKAQAIRRAIVEMIGPGRPGHLGGSCSVADIVAALYFCKLRHDPKNPQWPDRDRFLLSKGHAALAQYAALALCGYFPSEALGTLKQLHSILQGHPDRSRTPGVEANTGSLGQGLSIACGIALGARLDKKSYRVYCLLGDGELDEGQVWEAAMAASHYKLDHVVGMLDQNRFQATGPVTEILNTHPVADKWAACGWHIEEINGHDMAAIIAALDRADAITGRPIMIIAHTIKGKGVSFAENTSAFHHGAMSDDQYRLALRELASEQEL